MFFYFCNKNSCFFLKQHEKPLKLHMRKNYYVAVYVYAAIERILFMLCLGRRAGESILIGNDIIITMLGYKGGQVHIGITAPNSIKIGCG